MLSHNSSKYISSSCIMIYIRPFRLRLKCQLNLWFECGFILHVVKIDLTYLLLLNNTFMSYSSHKHIEYVHIRKEKRHKFSSSCTDFEHMVYTSHANVAMEWIKIFYCNENTIFNLFHFKETMQLYSGSSVIYLSIV